MRQRGALAVLGAVTTVSSLLAVGGTPAQAAPLVAPITRVGPDLTAAIVLDISSDGGRVLAGGFGGVQRIDRIGNAATAPIATPNLDVAITDDGGTMLAVNVDLLGTVTIVRTSPGSGNVTEVVAGGLGAGNWTRSGAIAISATGRFVAFTAADSLSFRQTVVAADLQGPITITNVRDLLTDRTLLANGRPSDGPFGAVAPTVTNLNVERAGQVIPNAVVATLANGSFDIFSQKSTHLVIDAAGNFRS